MIENGNGKFSNCINMKVEVVKVHPIKKFSQFGSYSINSFILILQINLIKIQIQLLRQEIKIGKARSFFTHQSNATTATDKWRRCVVGKADARRSDCIDRAAV